MTTIITREIGASPKGSPLTNSEVDQNFINLNTDKAEKASPTFTGTVTLPTSLVNVTTSSYPTIRPSLNLDFANSQSVDPRITFTRASTATRVRQDGLIEVVASNSPRIDFDPETDVCKGLLIEEQRTNLITYSENFDNAAWQGIATAFPNNIASPDGTITADTLSGAVNADKYQTVNSLTAGVQYTASIFVKAGTVNQLRLRELNSNIHADINLTLNTISVTSGVGTATLVNYGNNWFRATLSYIQVGAIALVAIRNNSAITGDWHVWGAQLEAGSFATSYIPSSDTFTSRASTATYVGSNGLIQSALTNVARYNYNPVNLALAPKLLLESASTNLLTYSEQFDNAAWLKYNATITANATTAPDGTTTADTWIEDTSATTQKYMRTPSTVVAGTYTMSCFVKAASGTRYFAMYFYDSTLPAVYRSIFNVSSGAVTFNYNGAVGSIVPYGNGWYRCIMTATVTNTISSYFSISNSSTSNAGYTGDGTSGLYLWGAQLEASSFPTSYIPTVASQVTRAADISSSAQTTRVADNAVMTGTNFSSWYNQTEGTVYFSGDSPPAVTTAEMNWAISDATINNIIFNRKNTANSIGTAITVNAVIQADMADPIAIVGNTAYKSTAAYKLNDIAVSTNGGTTFTDTSASIPTVNTLSIGQNAFSSQKLNGHISKLSYYPKRLTNSELQALTTG